MKKEAKLKAKWEKRLAKLGLGVDQLMTDNSDGELEQANVLPTPHEKHPDYAHLRTKIDSNDPFLEGGFEVKAIRSIEREIPEWALNDKEVQRVILTAFPKLTFDKPANKVQQKAYQKRIEKAGRWTRVIYLYYRMGLPSQIVTRELGITKVSLDRLLQAINWVAEGRRSDGKPRKVVSRPPTSVVHGEKGDEAK